MYRREHRHQLSFEDYFLPFGGKLSSDNRWIKIADLIPWDELKTSTLRSFARVWSTGEAISHGVGCIDHQGSGLGLTDEELVEQIKENPDLQFFIGLEAFQYSAPFDPSMLVYFRKRLPESVVNDCNERFVRNGLNVIRSSDVANLKGDTTKVAFISHFKEVQRLKTQLDQYTDLSEDDKASIEQVLPEDPLRGFRGQYLDTARQQRQQRGDPGGKGQAMDVHGDQLDTLKAGEGLSEAAIREGFTRFNAEQGAKELAAIATRHGLATAALQSFVDGILARMIFDGGQLSDLMAPLELGWKARSQAELTLMGDLVPLLTRRAGGREISGLSAYEQ